MNDLNENISYIEKVLHELDIGGISENVARRSIRDSLQNLAHITPDPTLSLADTFEALANGCSHSAKQSLGLITIRLISCRNVLPESSIKKSGRHIMRLIEEGCSDTLLTKVLQNKKAQTHEKLAVVSTIHNSACEGLKHLLLPFSNLQDLNGRRQQIMQVLNHGPTKNYLKGFGFNSVFPSVSSLLSLVTKVTQSRDHELQTSMQDLVDIISDSLNQYAHDPTFIGREYMLPFLNNVHSAAIEMQSTLAKQFICQIAVPTSSYKLEKKYSLHVVGARIQIFVQLTNEGPGTAQDLLAFCIADHCDVLAEETKLGNIVPGKFMLPLNFRVTEQRESIELFVEIKWQVVGDPNIHKREFSVMVEGQRTDLNWGEISLFQPYSLEVAFGDDFYGRKDTVDRILRRLSSNSMQSCYITGQKRVGKSSLARAVESRIKLLTHVNSNQYHVLYLECGEIRHASGEETLNALGKSLEQFLSDNLPRSSNWTSGEYSSSLRSLNRLIDELQKVRPDSRFVVILDEFDEINESLYRYGELADTFFLNLRTISSRKNIAFVLVGAERMPYVMAAQGERLNKFDRESLNSFKRETEWEDYLGLVRNPVENIIDAHESALNELFRYTNGHPYFTKMLCAAVYEFAVESKDAEVSSIEIERAASKIIGTLDINAFAHYWRDGIRGDAKEVEIVSLKRCRVLLAWARTARSNTILTCDEIQANVRSVSLAASEVLPLLEDFCRRGVFKEHDGEYQPTVKLFADWLMESGFSMLVTDQLGDELSEAKQNNEDKAFVESKEIVDVTNSWDLYQGREITTEHVRAWLRQVESNLDQRMLFKVLQNVRFVREAEIREKFKLAHDTIRRKLPVVVKKSRAQRRDDIVVTYADSLGKSGAYFANIYANTNEIVSGNVVPPSSLSEIFEELDVGKQLGLVIVDDMIGTGRTLESKIQELSESFLPEKIETDITMTVVVMTATIKGERRVRKYLEDSLPNAELEICELLEDKHFAFGGSLGFWETQEEKSKAQSLLRDLGVRVQKRQPLGFENQGLLLTFSRNCPNNSLPILHGFGRANSPWNPLFPRVKS